METDKFISYLEEINLAKSTQKSYLYIVETFFKWINVEAEQVTKPDILRYLEYLKNRREMQNACRKNYLIVLNHYFTHLYKEQIITSNPCAYLKIRGKRPKKLYKVYSEQELETLFDNYYNVFVRNFDGNGMHKKARKQAELCRERNAIILSVLINQGATTGEIKNMETGDLDLIKASLKLRGGKRSNERIVPIKATQIGLFMHYLQNVRPQFAEYQTKENEELFLCLPAISAKTTDGGLLLYALELLVQHLKEIDKQFLSLAQLRTSVITNWLKAHGLRRTQYLAGHRYVSSTEKYQCNNLDNLIDDINKLNPF